MSTISASTTSTTAYKVTADTTGTLVLQTGATPTTAVTIDTSQNVGIGTSSPTEKITISTAAAYSAVRLISGSATSYVVQRYSTDTNSNAMELLNTNASPMVFSTSNTERMRINAGAPILCLSGGNTSATGTGIAFPATQSSSTDVNTLDDYEEGTWTPNIGGTATYGTVIGTYTKIGDTVRIYFDISISVIGTGSTTTVSGVPFSCTYNDAGAISYYSTLNVNAYFVQAQMSGVTMTFPGTTAAQATITNTMAIFKSGTRILGTVVYKTST